MESVCEKLDDTLTDFFDILGQLYNELAHLETLMKSGFLDLSRARYNMGVHSVSPAQFHQDMKALVKVDVEKENGITTLKIIHPENDSKIDNTSTLRKRNILNTNEEKGQTDAQALGQNDNLTKTDEISNKKVTVDPINWFGVLVPQNLRRSQNSFKTAVETCVTIANLQLQLHELKNEYRKLLADKQELKRKEKELKRKEKEQIQKEN